MVFVCICFPSLDLVVRIIEENQRSTCKTLVCVTCDFAEGNWMWFRLVFVTVSDFNCLVLFNLHVCKRIVYGFATVDRVADTCKCVAFNAGDGFNDFVVADWHIQ